MNYLKAMEVTGQIRPAYAALTLRFDFTNPGSARVSPSYLFPLPEGAVITDMQLLTKDKVLMRSELVTAESTIYMEDGYQLMRLPSGIYSLSWVGLEPEEECTVVISCALRLPQSGDVCKMTLPFGIWLPLLHPLEGNMCPVSFSLSLEGVEGKKPYCREELMEFSDDVQGDKVLLFRVKKPGSVGYVRSDMRKGVGFYRIFCKNQRQYQKWDKDKIQLILDLSGGMDLSVVQRVKKLFYNLYLLLPKDTPVEFWSTGSERAHIPHDESEAFVWLQIQETGGFLSDTIRSAVDRQSEKTLSILVSGASALYPERLLDEVSMKSPIHLFVTAAGNASPLGIYWKTRQPGRYIWMDEGEEMRLEELLCTLSYDGTGETVDPRNGTVHDLLPAEETSFAANGYRDVFVSYTGDEPQLFYLLHNGERTEDVWCENDVQEFSVIPGQLYAAERSRRLRRLAEEPGATTVRALKRELKKLGEKYHILNSEMALVLPDKNAKEGVAVPFCTAVSDGMEAVFGKKSAFREGDGQMAGKAKERALSICRHVLLQGIRTDGAVCSPCTEVTKKTEETALAALAMRAVLPAEPWAKIAEDAAAYLETAPDCFWKQAFFAWSRQPFPLTQLRQKMPAREQLLRDICEKNSVGAAAMLLLTLG